MLSKGVAYVFGDMSNAISERIVMGSMTKGE